LAVGGVGITVTKAPPRFPASPLPALSNGATVTVGSFDGVHLGHQAVLREIDQRARAAGRASVLVTFDPHPLEVVNPEAAPPLLTTGPERLEILAQSPLDYVVILRFDRHLAGLTPEGFVRQVLLDRCSVRELVIGHDHGFGRGRSGDVETLRTLGARLGFAVDVVAPVDVGGQHVSSSRIRRAVTGGDLASAAAMLGRRYSVVGQVGQGEQRGRRLGVPTINLGELPARKLLPPDGVYAVEVEWRGGRAGGMMNQGPRPTFQDGRRVLEAHIFDFDGDLYGEWVRIEWIERLRDVKRFESLEHLKNQLQQDRTRALAVLRRSESRVSRLSHT
jgi:riboflavin kinase/FMN adenylyltransferase